MGQQLLQIRYFACGEAVRVERTSVRRSQPTVAKDLIQRGWQAGMNRCAGIRRGKNLPVQQLRAAPRRRQGAVELARMFCGPIFRQVCVQTGPYCSPGGILIAGHSNFDDLNTKININININIDDGIITSMTTIMIVVMLCVRPDTFAFRPGHSNQKNESSLGQRRRRRLRLTRVLGQIMGLTWFSKRKGQHQPF